MSEAHAMEHHEHEVLLTHWPLVIGVGALLLPIGFMLHFSWNQSAMIALVTAGVGVCAIIVGAFGWTAEVHRPKEIAFGFGKTAILVFIISEAMLFGGLFSGYFYNMIPAEVWPPANTPHGIPPLATALILSIFLLSSSGTIHMAEAHLEKRNKSGFLTWLAITMILGLIFVSGQAYEWSHLFAEEFTISTNVFSTFFFTITGFHGSHVVVGLIMQLFAFLMTLKGKLKHENDAFMKATGFYWHFVDGVWLLVLSILYVLPAKY